MALSQDDLLRNMLQYGTCNLLESAHIARRYVPGPLLWNHIFYLKAEKRKEAEGQLHEREERCTAVQRCGEVLSSLGQFCEETEVERFNLGPDLFGLEGFEGALRCVHKEGSFQLSSGAVTWRCLHVAGVICLNSYVLLSRDIVLQNKDAPEIFEKWKWNGDSCLKKFNEWKTYFSEKGRGARDVDEAMKLLYQWTLLPIVAVLYSVKREVMDDEYSAESQAYRESKRSDELCKFLVQYRELFEPSKVTEFLYSDEMYKCLCRYALLYMKMGNTAEATKLLKMILEMLEGIRDKKLTITDWGKGNIIEYIEPDLLDVVGREIEVNNLLINIQTGSGEFKVLTRHTENLEDCLDTRHDLGVSDLGSRPKVCSFLDWRANRYPDKMYHMFSAFGFEWLSEARELFGKTKDLNGDNLNARLREFLYSADIGGLIRHSCSGLKLEWESVRQKQDFLLHVCEALGDPQLMAKCLLCCASMIFGNAFNRFLNIEDSQTFKRTLQEELNLQGSPLALECVQKLIACLNDPWKPEEYERENLPDMLKAIRFTKRSVDIYSNLLHKLTEVTSNENEWLMLLESQKEAHNMMLAFHLSFVHFCSKAMLMTRSSIFSGDFQTECHLLLCAEPTENDAGQVSSNLVLRTLCDALLISTLVWMERGRARTLMKQLGGGDGAYPGPLKEELNKFNNDYEAAQSLVLSCHSACKGNTMFIEYHSQVSTPGFEQYKFTQAVVMHGKDMALITLNVCSSAQVENFIRDVDDFYKIIERLENLERESRLELLKASAEKELHSILERLYDKFMKPILTNHVFKHLEPDATLVIVPDKALYRVPFALLRNKKTEKHLFQVHKIDVVPSLRVLPHCGRRLCDLARYPLKPECILAVGNPSFNESTTPLPGTGEELKILQKCFGAGRVQILEEDEATRANFLKLVKEADDSVEKHVFAVIHLGVHGHWDKFIPGDDEKQKVYKTGSLQFAKPPQPSPQHSGESKGPNYEVGSGNLIGTAQRPLQHHTSDQVIEQVFKSEPSISTDGGKHHGSAFGEVGAVTKAPQGQHWSAAEEMLSSEDIVKCGFQWRALVGVLSACNSSRGQSYSDGEVNLPRALMIKGVPAAVVSQWKVSDVGSQMLMKEFYENLRYGQDVATAMQSAMIQLSDDPANSIFDWGPFLVWGLPTVQLPLELWTENAGKTHPTRQRAMSLKRVLRTLVPGNVKVMLFDKMRAVDNFLDAASKSSAFDKKVLTDAIIALGYFERNPKPVSASSHNQILAKQIKEESSALAEEFYKFILDGPLEVFKEVELELERCPAEEFDIRSKFWGHVKYTQAMRGNYEIALEYCNKIIEDIRKAPDVGNRTVRLLDTAVILRLMGRHEEALEEFDCYLASTEDNYDCLIQTSYLKHLMKDENGALVYALRAKKVKVDARMDKSWDLLVDRPLPDEFCQWLSNVDESTLTQTAASNAVAARGRFISLGWRLRSCQDENLKVMLLKAWKAVDTFLASAYNGFALKENYEVIVYAIESIELLMFQLSYMRLFSKDIIATAEDLYTMIPLHQLGAIELALEERGSIELKIVFRLRLMYMQAMKGNHQTALIHADKLMEVIRDTIGYDKSVVQKIKGFEGYVRLERAVILRLMKDYVRAHEELAELLEDRQENYECHIQMSYLKDLRGDKSGALEYALQAKRHKIADTESLGCNAFQLAFKALPDDYRQWLLNVDEESSGASSSSVRGVSSVQLPDVCKENATAEDAVTESCREQISLGS